METLFSEMQGALVVMPSGRLDTNTAPEAEKMLVDRIKGGMNCVVIDFTKTDYISSAGLRVILKAAKLLKNSGKIALCNANAQIFEVLELSGFLTLLTHSDNLEAALVIVAKQDAS
jgi:anti-sigma B factor antagonist